MKLNKLLVLFLCTVSLLVADKKQVLPQIEVTHTFKNKTKNFIIKRDINPICEKYFVTPATIYGTKKDTLPDECKRVSVGVLGKVTPVDVFGIKTIGEIEVLEHLKNTINEPSKYAFVDARREEWFEMVTIPSAINIPYTNIAYDEDFLDDHEKLLKTFNITYENGKYGFENVKTALVFCNGAWCTQSMKAFKELLKIGYPKEKLLWYRGGLQEWMNMGFTTIRGDLK
jgi:rhodanese-related sulfurtransferase